MDGFNQRTDAFKWGGPRRTWIYLRNMLLCCVLLAVFLVAWNGWLSTHKFIWGVPAVFLPAAIVYTLNPGVKVSNYGFSALPWLLAVCVFRGTLVILTGLAIDLGIHLAALNNG